MNVLIAANAAKRRLKMKTFTIDDETNNITLHTTTQNFEAVTNGARFRNESGLAKLTANWPVARLVEIWNSLPGETPVKKFTDRPTAVSRIWRAMQSLGQPAPATANEPAEIPDTARASDPETGATVQPEAAIPQSPESAVVAPVAPQTSNDAPLEAPAKNQAIRAKKAPAAAAKKKKNIREGSKTEAILTLMRQPGGTTLKVIMDVTNWQAHSVRGFISGTLGKKMGLSVASRKSENGGRSYSIKS
jgi:hypothetical protein